MRVIKIYGGCSEIIETLAENKLFKSYKCYLNLPSYWIQVIGHLRRIFPIRKNRGTAHFAAHGLHVGNWVGYPWAAHGNFAMQIRLPTTSKYGNSGQLSGQQITSKYEKVGSSVGNGVGCPWAAHGNFAMQIRLPTTSIYGYSGQLSGQLCGQPTTSKYGNSGQFSGQPTELPLLKMEAIFDSHARHL